MKALAQRTCPLGLDEVDLETWRQNWARMREDPSNPVKLRLLGLLCIVDMRHGSNFRSRIEDRIVALDEHVKVRQALRESKRLTRHTIVID